MSGEHVGRARHRMHVEAPAGVVYAVLADAVRLPLCFSASVHVERLELDSERERLRVWSLLDGRLRSWTASRRLDPVERRIEFWQERSTSLLQSITGALSVRDHGPREAELELQYGFSTSGDLPDEVAWAAWCADLNLRTQLTDLKRFAEQWTRLDELALSFEDSVRIHGPAELAYDFLYRAGDWAGTVPHIVRAGLTEDAPGVQRVTLETLTGRRSQTTESVRICFPHAGRIVYKRTVVPDLLSAHTGEWSVVPDETGVTVTGRQSVVLREEDIAAVLGESAGLAQARQYVRAALGSECLSLLALAKQHAESAVRML
uniref:Aromatase n=1 Tax=Streptomyces sp. CNH189 TaxID=1136432 RepID=M4T8U1_9ACTN|nr:aromatase [Streptomyces sp. CNH189]